MNRISCLLPIAILSCAVAAAPAASGLADDVGHAEDYRLFCERTALSAFPSPEMAIGMASSMEKIMPRGSFPARPIPDEELRVRLARNECESVQILVAPRSADLRNVRVKVEGNLVHESDAESIFPAADVTISPVGYVNVTNEVPYPVGRCEPADAAPGYARQTRKPEMGWWPDPILEFLDKVDVSGTDVQSFWVRVRCPESQKAGIYRGAIMVSADGVVPVRIPFAVRVNDFAIGRASPLPMAITFCPESANSGEKTSPARLWRKHREEWADFLADYFITMDDLYNGGGREVPFDLLERLKSQGRLGMFNLGYWTHPESTNEEDVATWRRKTVPRLRRVYDEAEARGLLGHAYCYGCDETKPEKYPLVRLAARELKAALPGVPLVSAFCCEYGVGATLDEIDWLVPQSWQYGRRQAEESRKAGHRVWWYICCGPQAPYANMFLECPAIEGRILMGAQTVRMRPDGFLYFQLTLWRRCERCIEFGSFTDWSPKSTFKCTYNGDGSWVCAGPDGTPLPTIRLENFRDGLEDYAYAKLLEEKFREMEKETTGGTGEASETGGDIPQDPSVPQVPSPVSPATPVLLVQHSADEPPAPPGSTPSLREAWLRRAQSALAVPDTVLDARDEPDQPLAPGDWKGTMKMYSMSNFTDDPEAVLRWRDEMADLIEACDFHQQP